MVETNLFDDDDELLFADEEENEVVNPHRDPWRVLIVDDEEEVHSVTKMVLAQFEFMGRALCFIDAYSAHEAKQILAREPDIALILLDVVMESDDAGLKLADFIRNEMNNHFVRIVLRTGQPGQAPEDRVILEYDINDYKAKTELTATKLFTTVVTSLRSYRDIMIIEHNKRGLRRVIDASPTIFKLQSLNNFTRGVLEQLTTLLSMDKNSLFCQGFTATHEASELRIVAATGDYEVMIDRLVKETVPDSVAVLLAQALVEKRNIVQGSHYVSYLPGRADQEYIIYVNGWEELNEWDRNLVSLFFTNVSVAHDNIMLQMEIEETQSEVIYTLGEIAEARSRETGNHVRRVALYSELMAKLYGLTDHEAESLRLASPMHDVGKLGIPDNILNKPGKLSREEWEIMKTHAGIGNEMLRHSKRPLMQAASIVAGQHHERWDGAGYPMGLKAQEIHIFGRITAVADVFDALSVCRVYKDAWPIDKVMAYFREEKGRHFDPRLVNLLEEHLDKFLAIRQKFSESWERGEV
ncbi:DUF3369 domain-containing protein [Acanthopleuribacter pedis]|uniref:DUF3369 domain-containing protein n=1 Tax=Acanthopleuribacter pedis TaxID=442870 RepID=A0A8J7U3I7_9BACT|nr:DUF3369 domain-containing protein [Acanthopleuribacter pedis]MBO1318794.1 DUF3369 domain-containing protein [Acanthopleuribacter pedis]